MSLLRFSSRAYGMATQAIKRVYQPVAQLHTSKSYLLKSLGIGTLSAVLTLGLYTQDAFAKRAGGGRSMGRSSHTMPHRGSPSHQSHQAAKPAQSPAKPEAGAQNAAQRNRWLGPIAGLAAGLGIAALLSHFGLGGAMGGLLANLLVVVGIMLLAYWGIRMLAKRKTVARNSASGMTRQEPFNAASPLSQPASSIAAEAQSAFGTRSAQETFAPNPNLSIDALNTPASVQSPAALAASFDATAFLRHAKIQFIRMQAAWDKGDLDDIREFTTPEIFAEVKLDLAEREVSHPASTNHTNVEKLDAQLLSMHVEEGWQYASVQFTGLIHEEPEQETAQPFSETWHFSKRIESSEVDTGVAGWVLAGIEQNAAY